MPLRKERARCEDLDTGAGGLLDKIESLSRATLLLVSGSPPEHVSGS